VSLVERELSSRCCNFDAITDVDRRAEVTAGDSVRFDDESDPVGRLSGGPDSE
jgi:hypothetical protein